ncbi:tetratricopeptide repeat protein [Mycetocola lacteus]|uniref:Tetratricopeptide repeat protein n=1 Tax=Mycetocola lacteus TaxID=76637 RepID=A0A3L7APR2_9MICO|nr:tetratricopeptide repeat protein [Mycetocola lacteus]RLP82337.1 tetratricopeptide repeat protein [Mycetocola lacteus]
MLTVAPVPHSPISFGVVKTIIEYLGVSPEHHNDVLTQSLRILYPLDSDLERAARAQTQSLTESATTDEQIRFFQHQRARRSFIRVAHSIDEEVGPISIHVSNANLLDIASREFLTVAVRVCNWSVTMEDSTSPQACSYTPGESEQHLLDLLETLPNGKAQDEILSLAFEYIHVGDAWTAIELGRWVQRFTHSPRLWNLLALAHAMLGETIEAEFYYDRWSAMGVPIDAARALYGKAMLAVRHHPDGLRDIDLGAHLLNTALELIQTLPAVDRKMDLVVFDEVFNRNGFALVMFRRGDVTGAISLLRWGIDALTSTSEKVAIHRSVLLYNLAQCYQKMGDLNSAIDTFRDLISVDPHMPEYHLEAAKCYALNGNLGTALKECRQAILLDDALAQSWHLAGVYEGLSGNHDAATAAHRQAFRLDPDTPGYLTDLVYGLVLTGGFDEAARYSDGWVDSGVSTREIERRASLSAEIALRLGQPDRALNALDHALELRPQSTHLRGNRDQVRRLNR